MNTNITLLQYTKYIELLGYEVTTVDKHNYSISYAHIASDNGQYLLSARGVNATWSIYWLYMKVCKMHQVSQNPVQRISS